MSVVRTLLFILQLLIIVMIIAVRSLLPRSRTHNSL
jgi:hypothetical protein